VAHYDSIIIGAGHNGLTCAAYLAKAGQKILVLESADSPGGLAGNREFHAGFRAPVAHLVNHFPEKIAGDLALAKHGFGASAEPLATVGLSTDGNHVVVQGHSVTGVDESEAAAYRKFAAQMQRFADVLKPFWLKTIPRATLGKLSEMMTFAKIGLKLRLLGKDDMREFMRVATLPARDLVDENFDNERLKAVLSWDGLIGSKMAPRSPNNAVLPMLYRMSGKFSGEPGSLVKALQASASAAGAEIRTSATVDRILVKADKDGLVAHGVTLAGGEHIEAARVISSADPQTTFIRLVGIENLEIQFTNRIKRLRCDGQVAKLHLALNGLPSFTGLDQPESPLLRGRLLIAPELDAIEFAFDHAKYGECTTDPVMEIVIPSLRDPSLAPPGQHVLSAHVMYAPYRLKGGWDDATRDALRESAIEAIAQYAPGIREQIIHAELLTPADLERTYHVTGGHWHHTEYAVDQLLMMHPTYEVAQYSTPLPGLYLCGAGCHPGGDLTGGPGHNAAQEILR
jgi:phytoene dehydrogenase-like protein